MKQFKNVVKKGIAKLINLYKDVRWVLKGADRPLQVDLTGEVIGC